MRDYLILTSVSSLTFEDLRETSLSKELNELEIIESFDLLDALGLRFDHVSELYFDHHGDEEQLLRQFSVEFVAAQQKVERFDLLICLD